MKVQYLVLALWIISCGQSTSEKKSPAPQEESKVILDSVAARVVEAVDHKTSLTFNEVIALARTKTLPHVETTNFDSFIDEDDYDEVDIKTLKLRQIYPDLGSEGHSGRAISIYKLPISDNFHSLVATVLKNGHEMETLLINYDTQGNLIAHEVVSYDEIAEGMSRVVSRISENKIAVHRIFWGNTKEVEEIEFKIRGDGTLEKLGAKRLDKTINDFALVNSIFEDLELDWVQTKTDLITTQEHPFNLNGTIVVIPEIVDEGEQYFNLDSHIVVAGNRSGKITHKFFESHRSNQWVSDAVELKKIEIDAAPYQISDGKEAFGIRVSYRGMSQVNPYENETLSLYTESGDTLEKVLQNYSVRDFGGEWDAECEGQFVHNERTLNVSGEKSKGYFDMLVNNKITVTKNYVDEQGDCDDKELTATEASVLKFNGNLYQRQNPNNPVSVLQLMLFTKKQAINHYGEPKLVEQFVLDDAQGEFRNAVTNEYTQEERQSKTISINELTWEKDANTWITVWYETGNDPKFPIAVSEWEKGSEF